MSKDTGGPAFPMAKVTVLAEDGTPSECAAITHDGMTLRDYFAVKAMHQFIAGAVFPKGYDRSNDLAKVAALAYETADAMLAEREK